jgi:hypothetical protein
MPLKVLFRDSVFNGMDNDAFTLIKVLIFTPFVLEYGSFVR